MPNLEVNGMEQQKSISGCKEKEVTVDTGSLNLIIERF